MSINTNPHLTEMKQQIKATIRRNSDRGFLPYGGCNQVCYEMMNMLEEAATYSEPEQLFDIHIMTLLEMVKLLSHADTSSGAAGDVIDLCLITINDLCKTASEDSHKHYFDTLIKTAKNKSIIEWADPGFELLKAGVHVIHDHKQAQKIYEIIPLYGTLYGGKDYPDKYIITLGIIERLEGEAAANQYLTEHIDIPDLRAIAVEKHLAAKQYSSAEKLCVEASKLDEGRYGKPAVWVYYLERLYTETSDQEKLIETVRHILLRGDTSYYKRLKELYQIQNSWDQNRDVLLDQLYNSLTDQDYALILDKEGDYAKLLKVVDQHKIYILQYGKQLAEHFPDETYPIYEEYIMHEAKLATDRDKYKAVCRIITSYFKAEAKMKALFIIDRLIEMYPRRPAMIDELTKLKKKWN